MSDDKITAGCGPQFQLVTICNRLVSFFFQSVFKHFPVISRIDAFDQHRHHIDNGEVPNLRLVIPNGANLSIPEDFYYFLPEYLNNS
ncbi:hypothetical protein [Fibrobacter sp.]|uniref:hypothetical protein n=1 Tax=Fibrobacter sp. TaxID=35828 RepID=UPI00388CF752